jgi:hypothetical protein
VTDERHRVKAGRQLHAGPIARPRSGLHHRRRRSKSSKSDRGSRRLGTGRP